jgi:hypothetical protein
MSPEEGETTDRQATQGFGSFSTATGGRISPTGNNKASRKGKSPDDLRLFKKKAG